MIRNDRLRKRIITSHDDVAALLPTHRETKFLKRTNEV